MLNERNYMNETPEEREKRIQKANMQQELFRLYGIKKKSILDKWKIKRIENKFRKS